MSSEDRIQDYLAASGWIRHDDLVGSEGKSLYSIQSDTGTGEVQTILVIVDGSFFQILSAFAARSDLSAEDALRINNTVLGMVEFGGHYCVSFVAVNSAFSEAFFAEMKGLVGAIAWSLANSLNP